VSRIFFNFIPLAWLAALAKQKLEESLACFRQASLT